MFRKLVIAVITAVAALLETVADAITATLPPPAADSPRLRVVASGRLCLRLRIVSPPPCRRRTRQAGQRTRPAGPMTELVPAGLLPGLVRDPAGISLPGRLALA